MALRCGCRKLALAEERIAELKERLDEMRRELGRAQAGEDAWKEQCERTTRHLALPAPADALAPPKPADAGGPLSRAWRWMRAAG